MSWVTKYMLACSKYFAFFSFESTYSEVIIICEVLVLEQKLQHKKYHTIKNTHYLIIVTGSNRHITLTSSL